MPCVHLWAVTGACAPRVPPWDALAVSRQVDKKKALEIARTVMKVGNSVLSDEQTLADESVEDGATLTVIVDTEVILLRSTSGQE